MRKKLTKAMLRKVQGIGVRNMQSSRYNDVPNQFIMTIPTVGIVFQSYRTIIAIKLLEGGTILDINWDYSKTTGRYRNQFLGETLRETRKKIASGEYVIENLN